MASRYSAARPKRAGEAFARQHHGEAGDDTETPAGGGGGSGVHHDKKVKFDVRNPSALAPAEDALREDDDVLDADVIGVGMAATKRGAVNIDGYDSDSENETFNARAEQRTRTSKKGGAARERAPEDVDLVDQLDNYDKRLKGDANGEGGGGGGGDDEDEDDDMFAENDDDDDAEKDGKKNDAPATGKAAGKKRWKEVRFLDDRHIEGQEDESRSGGHIHIRPEEKEESDGSDDSDDEAAVALAIQEEGVDEEVGLGGLKKHAPKLDAFNMKQEQEEGAFDEAGNYLRKAADPDALHDRWLEGINKKEMKKAAAAEAKRAAEQRQLRAADDGVLTADLFAALLSRLERGETALEALARLGRGIKKAPKAKRIPKWRLQKKMQGKKSSNGQENGENGENGDAVGGGGDQMDVDKDKPAAEEDPEQTRRKQDIDAITEAADRLLNRDYPDIYDTERERLAREYRAETGEAWVDPPRPADDEEEEEEAGATSSDAKANNGAAKQWEYRWTDGRDGGAIQGPYDGAMMKAWQDAGYFEGVEFREVGSEGGWSHVASFV